MTASGNAPDPALAQQIEQGYGLLRQQRFGDAVQFARALAASSPDSPHVLVLAAEASLAIGAVDDAVDWTDRAIFASGGNPFLKLKKARLLGQVRRRAQVPALAAEISATAGNDGPVLWQLATLYYRNNLQPEAIAHFQRAHAVIGDHPGLLYEMATARFFSGDFEQAERDIERLLRVAGDFGPALYLRATLRRQTPERNHLADLEQRIAAGFRNPDDEAAALYALAKENEDLGRHDASFDALARGAARRRGTLANYSLSAELASMQAIRDAYTRETMATPVSGHDGEGAIFIVGMPRSGTTLVERSLVQSGRVRSAGELLDFGNLLAAATQPLVSLAQSQAQASLGVDFAALGAQYMDGARQAAGGSALFIDKMPVNYLYCGMIARALPGARIIHLVRDPLDSCYAVFKTLFFNSYSFSYDLEELADYYIGYRRMMAHWHEVMPGRILDVHYEELVTDTEAQMRRIYGWCGLEWTADVLEAPTDAAIFATASAAQVREPVHSRSVGSAARHRRRMGPLVDRLTAAGLLAETAL